MCTWFRGVSAVVVSLALASVTVAQPYPAPRSEPWRALSGEALRGTWLNQGDPSQPCSIEAGRGSGRLVLTNEKGDVSWGRIVGRERIIADNWGGLVGEFEGNVIYWNNGTQWVRGSGGWGRPVPTPTPFPGPVMPVFGTGLRGTWFYQGDRRQPCGIELTPGGDGEMQLVFTNEKGDHSWGRMIGRGRVVADSWGGLEGEVRGNVIFWNNGTRWTR